MMSEDERPTIEELLTREHEPEPQDNRFANYPLVTPERIALLQLHDCNEQLERSADDPIRLAQAAKSAHLALQAALTAAVAGSMNIGAYERELELQWLDHLQGDGQQPKGDRVMRFEGLLDKATTQRLEWRGTPLPITPEERTMLNRLTFLRHRIEHPRPCFWLIEPAYIFEVLPLAVRLTEEALSGLWHHFEPEEAEEVRSLSAAIIAKCPQD